MVGLKQAAWGCIFVVAASTGIWDEEEKKANPPPPKPAAEATTDEIAHWIKQLGADKFADRQAAGKKLFAAGKPAIPPLVEAAADSHSEVVVRSIDLLQQFLEPADRPLSQAAREALEKLSQSNNPATARRARLVLHPNDDQQEPEITIVDLRNELAQRKAKGLWRRVNVSVVNGAKDTQIEESGRKTHIRENTDGSIRMEVTEWSDGKATTQEFATKSADELKTKSPEAYKIYQGVDERNPRLGGQPPNFAGRGGTPPPGPARQPRADIPGQPARAAVKPSKNAKADSWKNAVIEMKKSNKKLKVMRENDLSAENLSPPIKEELRALIADVRNSMPELIDSPATLPRDRENQEKSILLTVNGRKFLSIEMRGSKVNIMQFADGSIKLSISKTVDGQTTTSNSTAKSLADLQKKFPAYYEAFRIHVKDEPAKGDEVPRRALDFFDKDFEDSYPKHLSEYPGLWELAALELVTWKRSFKMTLFMAVRSSPLPQEMVSQCQEFKRQLDELDKRLREPETNPEK